MIQPFDHAWQEWTTPQGVADLQAHWEAPDSTKAAVEARVAALAAAVPHATVVDLGCAYGRYVTALPPFTSYCGYDIAEGFLAEFRRRYSGRSDVTCVQRSIFDGPDYTEPVDLLLSIDTSRHYHDPVGLLAYIRQHWPARHYLFSLLYGDNAMDLLNGRAVAATDLAAFNSRAAFDEDLRPYGWPLTVRYMLLEGVCSTS